MSHQMNQRSDTFKYDELLGRCMGNIDFMQRILSRFETRIESDLTDLQQEIMGGDTEKIASVAHRIKGAAANVSAVGLQTLAEEIENLAQDGQPLELEESLEKMREENICFFNETVSSLAQHAT